jgi:hypothetical protein
MGGWKAYGTLRCGREIINGRSSVRIGGRDGVLLGRTTRMMFILAGTYSVKLHLLFSDHLEHPVDLCFLFLFQFIVNFA